MGMNFPKTFLISPPNRWRRDAMVCFGFRWIGQHFQHCDNCGEPYWEHTHYETMRGDRWFRRSITPIDRARMRAGWEYPT